MSSLKDTFGDIGSVNFIRANEFEGDGLTLTFLSVEKLVPEDSDFLITGSQNEIIKDRKGVAVLTKDGKEIPNPIYDPNFPNGYEIKVNFEEGQHTSCSLLFLKALVGADPSEGDTLNIKRSGEKFDTKYVIRKIDTNF